MDEFEDGKFMSNCQDLLSEDPFGASIRLRQRSDFAQPQNCSLYHVTFKQSDMVTSRFDIGVSDPVSYDCDCSARHSGGGFVLLFYRYFANSPNLPHSHLPTVGEVDQLAAWHKSITLCLEITGKIRVASEGFNVTVGGTKAAIEEYINVCVDHWSFAGLDLSSFLKRKAFFKPSPGCACVFKPATTCSIRVCAEITPLGITNYTPKNWDVVEELAPEEFHRRCKEEKIVIWDLRNHYESRIGFFVDGCGQEAFMPQIRRFSQFPQLVKSGRLTGPSINENKQVLTYCTGGIRCEKATRWIAEQDPGKRICTLRGGIQAYLDWMDGEIEAGRKGAADSLFRGRNYVFDSRGSLALQKVSAAAPVARCHVCQQPEDRLGKCVSKGCHLVLVVCETCEANGPRCCESCMNMDTDRAESIEKDTPRAMCDCERQRELKLWGEEHPKRVKRQGGSNASSKLRRIDI